MVEHLLPGHAEPFAERHHAAVMGVVNRRIVDFLDVHIADHISPRLDHRAIADHVAKPARKVIGEIGMLGSENPRALDGQVLVDELDDFGFALPPCIGYRVKNIFLGNHTNGSFPCSPSLHRARNAPGKILAESS